MNKNIVYLVLISFLITSPAFALEEILKSYRGVRSLGMGGVVHTTGVLDEALFANPALHGSIPQATAQPLNLTVGENTNLMDDYSKVNQVRSASGSDVLVKIANLNLTGRNESFRFSNMSGYYTPELFQDISFAFGFLISNQTSVMLRSNADIQAQLLSDIGPNFGTSYRLMDGALTLGLNAHILYRVAGNKTYRATDFLSGQRLRVQDIAGQGLGVDGDLGAYYQLPKVLFFQPSVGASVTNVIASNFRMAFRDLVKSIGQNPTPNKRNANFGVRLDFPSVLFFGDSLVAAEIQDLGSSHYKSSTWKKLHFGGETTVLSKFLTLRAGVNQGYIAGGIGLSFSIVRFDLTTYGEELGTNTGLLEDRRVLARLGLEF